MEQWLQKNQNKIGFMAVIFIMWCFYSIVHQGGNIIPRIDDVEFNINELESRLNENLNNHKKIIHYGREKPIN